MLLHNLQQGGPLSFGANTCWSWVMAAVVLGIHLLHRESEGTCCFYEQYIQFLLVVGVWGFFFLSRSSLVVHTNIILEDFLCMKALGARVKENCSSV